MEGLAKHYEGHEHPFSACMSDPKMVAQYPDEETRKQVCGKMKSMLADTEMRVTCVDLANVPIFDVEGKWKGRHWTTQQLDEMVANHEKLAPFLRAPVKLGHDDKQLLGQKNGQPALGYISRLHRKGKQLLADLSDVPTLIVNLMRSGAYRARSVEFFPQFEASAMADSLGEKVKGVTGHAVTGLALLGADLPECKTLGDLAAVLAADGMPGVEVVETCPPEGCSQAERFAAPSNPAQRDTMAEDVTKQIADLETRMRADLAAALEKQRTELEAAHEAKRTEMAATVTKAEADAKKAAEVLAERTKRLEDEAAAANRRATHMEAEAFVAEQSKGGSLKIPPSARRLAVALYEMLPDDGVCMSAEDGTRLQVFSAEDDAKPLTARQLFQAYVAACPDTSRFLLSEVAKAGKKSGGPETFAEAREVVAAREKLNLRADADMAKATTMTAAEFPQLVAAENARRR